jgi:beta-carotene 3-hydroxylase
VIVAVVALLVLVLMEPYSVLVHRYVWHHPLWRVHRHHHRAPVGAPSVGFNPNDVLSVSHAPVSIALALIAVVVGFGTVTGQVALGACLGMIVYGSLYVLFHDGVVHGRLPVQGLMRYGWVRAIVDAHAEHHRTNHEPYGFFVSPLFVTVRAPSRATQRAGNQAPDALAADADGQGALARERAVAHEPHASA